MDDKRPQKHIPLFALWRQLPRKEPCVFRIPQQLCRGKPGVRTREHRAGKPGLRYFSGRQRYHLGAERDGKRSDIFFGLCGAGEEKDRLCLLRGNPMAPILGLPHRSTAGIVSAHRRPGNRAGPMGAGGVGTGGGCGLRPDDALGPPALEPDGGGRAGHFRALRRYLLLRSAGKDTVGCRALRPGERDFRISITAGPSPESTV